MIGLLREYGSSSGIDRAQGRRMSQGAASEGHRAELSLFYLYCGSDGKDRKNQHYTRALESVATSPAEEGQSFETNKNTE